MQSSKGHILSVLGADSHLSASRLQVQSRIYQVRTELPCLVEEHWTEHRRLAG